MKKNDVLCYCELLHLDIFVLANKTHWDGSSSPKLMLYHRATSCSFDYAMCFEHTFRV